MAAKRDSILEDREKNNESATSYLDAMMKYLKDPVFEKEQLEIDEKGNTKLHNQLKETIEVL